MDELISKIKAEANRLGFSLFGITTADPPEHFDYFTSWLAKGYHGEMHYLSRPDSLRRRADPREYLADCGSIIILGMNYPAPDESTPSLSISSYAKGMDYHLVIPPRLKQLVTYTETCTNRAIESFICTDSSPVLERELGQRAGLGWIGRNSCLISPVLGSYFFLAEIFININLPPTPPLLKDHCGTCHRCLDACPTGCIQNDRSIDARGCISYLTIENKGIIPVQYREKMNGWIFGCDICQQVCPWNKQALSRHVDKEYQASNMTSNLDIQRIVNITSRDFSLTFHSSPIQRIKRRGLLRNALIAAGNQGQVDVMQLAIKMIQTEFDPVVKGSAIWAISQLHQEQGDAILKALCKTENDPIVLQELSRILR